MRNSVRLALPSCAVALLIACYVSAAPLGARDTTTNWSGDAVVSQANPDDSQPNTTPDAAATAGPDTALEDEQSPPARREGRDLDQILVEEEVVQQIHGADLSPKLQIKRERKASDAQHTPAQAAEAVLAAQKETAHESDNIQEATKTAKPLHQALSTEDDIADQSQRAPKVMLRNDELVPEESSELMNAEKESHHEIHESPKDVLAQNAPRAPAIDATEGATDFAFGLSEATFMELAGAGLLSAAVSFCVMKCTCGTWRADERQKEDREYWRSALDGAQRDLSLVTDLPRTGNTAGAVATESVYLSANVTSSLLALADRCGVTLSTVLTMAVFNLMNKYTREKDMVIGVRLACGDKTTVLPVRAELEPATCTVSAALKDFKSKLQSTIAHSDLPLEQIKSEWLGERGKEDDISNFKIVVGLDMLATDADRRSPEEGQALLERNHLLERKSGWLFATDFGNATTTSVHELQFHTKIAANGTVGIQLVYRTDLFKPATIQSQASALGLMLTKLSEGVAVDGQVTHRRVADNKLLLSKVPLVTDEAKVRTAECKVVTPWRTEQCIDQWFEETAIAHPDNVALLFEGEEVTYKQLNDRVNIIASTLRSFGVSSDVKVALLMNRGVDTIEAIYGVLRAGGAYVPIDTNWPVDRINEVLCDCSSPVVMTQTSLLHTVPAGFSGEIICVDTYTWHQTILLSPEELARDRSPDDLVYSFFTSGTTGKPKGVLMEHKSLVKRQCWMADVMPLQKDECVLQKTDYNFGISEWEFFWPLQVGATLLVAKPDGQKDNVYLLDLLQNHRVAAMTYVPSALHTLLDHMEMEEQLKTTSVKYVLACGEKLPLTLCQQFYTAFDAQLMNLCGPTEGDMTYWVCPKLEPATPPPFHKIPIGHCLSNAIIYVLDDQQQLLPDGACGEMYIGTGIARGYLNRPEETSAAFIEDPFRPGERMYKTGDIGVRNSEGLLHMIGRADHQIKLRGYRIELGEIESALSKFPGVTRSLARVHGEESSAKLVAYVTPDTIRTDSPELKAALKASLPTYMMPSQVIALKEFPRTSRGKIDLKKLPAPTDQGAGMQAGPVVKAGTPMEKLVESTWKTVLCSKNEISIVTNFTSAGGNSLLAGKVVSILRKNVCSGLAGTSMYTHDTIKALAAHIDEHIEALGGSIGAGEEEKTEPVPEPVWHAESPYSLKALLWQGFSTIILTMIADDFIEILELVVIWNVWLYHGVRAACLAAPLIPFALLFVNAIFALSAKWLLIGTYRTGQYRIHGNHYYKSQLVDNLTEKVSEDLGDYISDTVLINSWARALGAKIGHHVEISDCSVAMTGGWDLITIGDNTTIQKNVKVNTSYYDEGLLIFLPLHVGHGCLIEHQAVLVASTVLPPGTRVGPMSSSGLGRGQVVEPWLTDAVGEEQSLLALTRTLNETLDTRAYNWPQQALRLACGIPFLMLMNAGALVPTVYAMISYGGVLSDYFTAAGDSWYTTATVFMATVPWAFTFMVPMTYFAEAVLVKWLIIGKFTEGTFEYTEWDSLRRWIMDRINDNGDFKDAMEPWVATELLAVMQRLMGAHVGSRVQTDCWECSEYDLIHIDDEVVFGHAAQFHPTDKVNKVAKKIVLDKGCNVLDNNCVMSGAHIKSGAVCGSLTLTGRDQVVPPFSISTGAVNGQSMLLRERSAQETEGRFEYLAKDEREMVLKAHERNTGFAWFWGFNLFVILFTLIFSPVMEVATMAFFGQYGSMIGFFDNFGYFENWHYFLIGMAFLQMLHAANMIFAIVLKWLVIGKYKAGNYPFFTEYHFKWHIMMAMSSVEANVDEWIGDTVFHVWFLRAMGANIEGDLVQINGSGLEYDLLHIGERTCIGGGVDMTCHTVENMVIKLAPVTVGRGCCVRSGSVVMPGGELSTGATLMENSQVLKGETVPPGKTFAGLPAAQVNVHPGGPTWEASRGQGNSTSLRTARVAR
jgi:amino acid adenylation domain-containing protein